MSTRTRRLIGWSAAVVAALLIAAAIFANQNVIVGHGPLFTGEESSRTESGGSWETGTVISFGAPKIRNPTSNTILIRKVSLTPETSKPGATVTAIYVVDLTGIGETTGLGVGFPPSNQAQHTFMPATGATLKPNTWYQVMFVVHLDRDGEWTFPSFEITYEAGDRRYKATVHDGLRLCAPKNMPCGGVQ